MTKEKFEQFKKLDENSQEMRDFIKSCTLDEVEMLFYYQQTKRNDNNTRTSGLHETATGTSSESN